VRSRRNLADLPIAEIRPDNLAEDIAAVLIGGRSGRLVRSFTPFRRDIGITRVRIAEAMIELYKGSLNADDDTAIHRRPSGRRRRSWVVQCISQNRRGLRVRYVSLCRFQPTGSSGAESLNYRFRGSRIACHGSLFAVANERHMFPITRGVPSFRPVRCGRICRFCERYGSSVLDDAEAKSSAIQQAKDGRDILR